MSWILVALIAPFVWSLINHCDKFILSRYFKGGGSGGLMIFVGVVALPVGLALYVTNPSVLDVSNIDKFSLIVSGLLYNLAVLFYLFALEKEDASSIVPFWQLSPVFAYFLGIFFLGEKLSADKLFAGTIVIFGALLLTFKFRKGEKTRINTKVAFTMILSSLCIALGYVLFKDGSSDTIPFVVSMFWNQVGMVIFATVCFLIKKYRKEFLNVVYQNSFGVLGLNIVEQMFETVGIVASNFAVLLAPAALVILVEYSVQPMFVFLFGIFFTLVFPKFVKEDISRNNLAIKFISIIIMSIGVYLIQ